ncbi:MAG: helix-turn-helix transcriptional regulator [Deltaproteobacteria bacterium]|nr:helix-turn-helix transcriptional regulator [Deltaproteobacteria bacterium]
MNSAKVISNIIRQERKARKLNQQELADLSGTGLNFISQLERGKPTVRLDKLLEVLAVLGLELHIQRGKQIISVAKEFEK